jgi:tyrosine-protein kinase Etk/Wzc
MPTVHDHQETNGVSPAGNGGDTFWRAAAILVARWKTVAAITGVTIVLAIAVALALPREYAAEASVLRPAPSAINMLFGAGETGTGGLSRLLGGGGGDYSRYLAILTSRSLRETVVQRFDLLTVYKAQDQRFPMDAALKRLDKNLAFPVSPEFGHLTIVVYDRDPERSAAIANFMVDELNRRHAAMTSDNARLTRVFVEQRLEQARATMDSVRTTMQAFQEQHGIVELESQAQAFMSSMATQSARLAEIEVRYRTLVQQYGPDNPQVIAARNAYQAARQQVQGALGGSDALLPLALRDMPAASRQYAQLVQEQMIQAKTMEAIYPILEQARFQELNETRAVQVLDQAVVPTRPSRPSRRLIVIVAALTGLFAGVLLVLGQSWIRENHTHLAGRLQAGRAARPPRVTH